MKLLVLFVFMLVLAASLCVDHCPAVCVCVCGVCVHAYG